MTDVMALPNMAFPPVVGVLEAVMPWDMNEYGNKSLEA